MKQFAPGWKMTMFTVVLLPVVISLGIWQINRGAEKRGMEMDYLTQLTQLPVAADALSGQVRFQRVRLHGYFGAEYFLVDNQIVDGRTGYWVIQVFNDHGGRRYLVNRGYWPAPKLRADLPAVPTPLQEEVKVVGAVWPYTGLVPVLDEDEWSTGWPKRVQRLDISRMAAAVDAEPVEIRLEPGQPGVDHAAPFAKVLSDAKHLGYAATWFGLAVVLSIGFVVFGFRQSETKSSTNE